MTKDFKAIQPTLTTRYQAIQCLSRELRIRVKVWGGRKSQNTYTFVNMEHQKEYERMNYLKNILTRMSDKEWADLQYRQFQIEQDLKAQTKMF